MEIIDNYKTPLKKLCKRFLKSRNEWKIKCHAAKNEIKRLSNLNRYFKNGRISKKGAFLNFF